MTRCAEGLVEAAVRTGPGPRDGGVWWDGPAGVV